MTAGVIRLADAAEASLARVGGKARTLGRLQRAGFRVPDGIVVAPDQSLDGPELRSYVEELGSGPFAVRSSGAAEDGPDASLAGKYRSILGVEPESIVEAVNEVRNSALLVGDEAIPVLTQAMIDPVCAGVAFTADPVTGDRSKTIVTGTRGVSDRLLSGQLPGDEWVVDGGRRARGVRSPEGVLSRRLVKQVAGVAADIARELGSPQDIEWAWDGDVLWVVQSRSITKLPDEVSWEAPASGVYQRSLRFGEWIPEPVTPLFETWLLPRMERRLHDWLHDEIGQVAPEPLHVVVNGWYYYSLNWLPVPGVAFLRNLISITRHVGTDWRRAAPMFPQTVRFGYLEQERDWRDNILPSYHQLVSRAEEAVEELEPLQLPALIDELATEAGLYFASIATVAGSAYKFEAQLAQFWNKHLRKALGVSHMVVLQGLDVPPEVYETARLETLDWSVPPVQPGGRPNGGDELKARAARIVQETEEILARRPRRLRKFRRLLSESQHMGPVREEQLSLLSLPWPVMRRAVHRIGQVLVDGGAIDSVDDVFYLTRSESIVLLGDPQPMGEVIAARRKERARASRLVAPLWVGEVPPMARFVFASSERAMGAVASEGAIVSGTPASPGRATGPVRVVRNSAQFDDFQEGEVLVAPLTAPAWTDLFDRAAAVVTDVGSALAHASIIAREFGIPAVVGCGDATSRLRDGQMVMVDGSAGNVEYAPPAAP